MRQFNLRLKGMLTRGNAEAVAKLFRLLLTHRKFTYINVKPSLLPRLSEDCPQYVDTRVDAYTRRKLIYDAPLDAKGRKPSAVRASHHADSAMLCVSTEDYLVMYDTRLEGEHAQYDHLHKNPYIAFDGDRVTIKHQTPCGDQVVEMFIL